MTARRQLVEDVKWSEARIGALLAYQLFNGRSVLVVPNCKWTGYECDMLVVTQSLRIIDVEIKISRADLKADAKKDKWWKLRPWSRRHKPRERREWPEKVWKHYYAMPESIYTPDLLAHIPAASGVLLLREKHQRGHISVARRCKPNRDAQPIGAADAVDLARLASLRMWAALTKKE